MAYKERSFIGAGKLYLGGLFVGNVPALTLGFESEELTLVDKTQGGGGVYNTAFRISNVNFEFTFNDYNANNLSFALFGGYEQVDIATVSGETAEVPAGFGNDDVLIPWAGGNICDVTQAVTVTTDGAGTPVDGVDYSAQPGGLLILNTGTEILAGETLTIGYTTKGMELIQALTDSGQEYLMLFDGLNDAQNGDSVVVNIFRGKPSPADGLPMISDEHAENTVSGAILSDQTKVGAGVSKYFIVSLMNAST